MEGEFPSISVILSFLVIFNSSIALPNQKQSEVLTLDGIVVVVVVGGGGGVGGETGGGDTLRFPNYN